MISTVLALKKGRETLGVRIRDKKGTFYDLSIDVFQNQLGLDPTNLPSRKLIEYGDLLMTEDEYQSGVLIEDASSRTDLYPHIQNYMKKREDANRREKVSKYRQEYFTYLPNDWLKDFAEYHYDNFEGNKNIYRPFTQEQKQMIREYFRWRSRTIFEEELASKTLVINLKKAQKLVDLKGATNDWEYDGTVDTGYLGGGVCQLGHSLRYEHYAVSPSQQKEIIFGSTCMSDFFEVDKDIIRRIEKTQTVILKEIKSIVYVIDKGKQEEYGYPPKEVWEVLKHFKGQFDEHMRHGSGWAYFIGGFTKLDLPLTRSMKQKYEALLRKYKQGVQTNNLEQVYSKVAHDLQNYSYDRQTIDKVLHGEYEIELAHILRDMLLMGNYTSPFVSTMFSILPTVERVQKSIYNQIYQGKDFLSKAERRYPFMVYDNTRRLATEKEYMYKSPYIEEQPLLGETKTKQLKIIFAVAKHKKFFKTTEVPTHLTEKQERIIKGIVEREDEIKDAFRWGMRPIFKDEVESIEKRVFLPKTHPDERINTRSILYQFEFIQENSNKMTDAERFRFNRIRPHILDMGLEDSFINNVYNRVLKRLKESDTHNEQTKQEPPQQEEADQQRPERKKPTVVAELDSSLEADLHRIIEAGATGKIPSNHFALTVIPTIFKLKRMTEGQKKFVDDALSKI